MQNQPETQPIPEWTPDDEPTTPPRRSPFRSHRNYCAGSMELDGTRYFYRELSDPLKEWMEDRPQWVANQLGVSLEAFSNDRYVPDTPANRAAVAKLPPAERPELAKADEVRKLSHYFEEAYNRVLSECLVDCDYPGVDFAQNPDLKKDLAMEVKATLVAQIARSTRFGLSQQTFPA